jgi:hypothetical protein
MAVKGIIVLRGDMGNPETHYAKCQVTDVQGTTALDTLASALGAHTNCNIAKKSYISIVLGTDEAPGAEPPANVDRKAIIYMRDPTTLRVHVLTLASPVDADVEDTPEGERITNAAGVAITGLVNTATGREYTFMYGKVIQKR